MKQKFFWLATVCLFVITGSQAKTTDNFNSRPGLTCTQIKTYLQNHCWAFPGFDINRNNWNPGIEGDGAMVSSTPAPNTGIYTPVLNVENKLTISFTYKFNQSIAAGTRRWIKIYLADANNSNVVLLDSIEFKNISSSTFYTYNKTNTSVKPGQYKVFLNYGGNGGTTSIAIDQLDVSSSLFYETGCNNAPVAGNDKFVGYSHHYASGDVALNDKDPDHESMSTYLVTNSPDGTVVLNTDGSFTFTPKAEFAGKSTSFTYKACDQGSLCSMDATVTINFPNDNTVPVTLVSLVDFKGLYLSNGDVELSWVTNNELGSNKYEIERSFDGYKWKSVGALEAGKIANQKKAYEFVDEIGRNKVEKKDLYYRLKQVEAGGKIATSRMLVVRVYNTRALKMLAITPNPAKNDIAVTAQLNEKSFVAMKITDADGAIMLKKAVKADAGASSYMIEGSSNLKPGKYTLEVTVNSKERMLIQLLKE
jgi:Bacterial Ig domain